MTQRGRLSSNGRPVHQLPSPSCSTASSNRTSSMAPQSSVSREKLPSSCGQDSHMTTELWHRPPPCQLTMTW